MLVPLASGLLLSVATGALAAVSPTLLQPGSHNSWTQGTVETVVWVTDGLDLAGVNGTVLLGHMDTDGTAFLWKDQPLAQNVPLADGKVNVRCPLNVPPLQNYVIALLGDENNLSSPFEIFAPDETSTGLPSAAIALPSTLSTTGNIPSVTITRSSVVGTIPPRTSTAASSGTTAPSSPNSGVHIHLAASGHIAIFGLLAGLSSLVI
ncbi:hypothetical protein BD413DRAFT_221056 [Trametes elegans]|nr:hypothetical protein BD413DRAFT_221056 [Trametes elegans]